MKQKLNCNQQQYDATTGVTQVINNISVGKYDVVIDTGPNFASRRREAQDALMKLAQVWPGLMQVAPDLVVGTIDAPGMEAIAERAKRALPPQITVDPDSPEGQAMKNQPPPPDPAVMQQQAEAQRKQQEGQQQFALKQQQFQADSKLKQQEAQAKDVLAQREFERKAALDERQFEFDKSLALQEFGLKRVEAHHDAVLDVGKQMIHQAGDRHVTNLVPAS